LVHSNSSIVSPNKTISIRSDQENVEYIERRMKIIKKKELKKEQLAKENTMKKVC
jgi:hypothetical protein